MTDVTEQELAAAAVAPRVTKDRIEARIASATFHRLTGTLTMCVLELENGFTVTGQSACAAPANFNQEIGERLAREDAFGKIWSLEGYLLRELLWREERDGKFARMDAELQPAVSDTLDLGRRFGPQADPNGRNLDVGLAMLAARAGRRVARAGWNGRDMFVYFVPAAAYPANRGAMARFFGEGAMVPYNDYLALKGADGKVSTWAPSGSDALASDWFILDDDVERYPPHVERMVDEYLELTERVCNLRKFVAGGPFEKLPAEEQERMAAQLEAMDRYHAALAARLMAAGVSF